MIQTMDGEAINDYLDKVMAGRIKVVDPLEGKAVEHFQRIRARADSLSANLSRIEKQVEGLKDEIASTKGEMKAYANILGEAEDSRRTMAKNEAEQKANDEAERKAAEADTPAAEPKAEQPDEISEEAPPLQVIDEEDSNETTASTAS